MEIPTAAVETMSERADLFRRRFSDVCAEIEKVIVGQTDIVDGVLTSLFVGGHVLLEGVPGLGKTLLVRTLGDVLGLQFSRIQFTPDLMPADVIGTTVINETPEGHRTFTFRQGPIFTQLLLADEINRATPKTQSALLEAMQEKQVTSGNDTFKLQEPFFVLATQNPIEQEGTYPLPEAQLDRFLLKLLVPYVTRSEMAAILDRTTTNVTAHPNRIMDGQEIQQWRQLVREVLVGKPVQDYAIRLVLASQPESEYTTPETTRYIRCGASPRGAQALILCAKVRALLKGRYNVSFDDLRAVYLPTMRHRVLLNFEAQAENIPADVILKKLLEHVPEAINERD